MGISLYCYNNRKFPVIYHLLALRLLAVYSFIYFFIIDLFVYTLSFCTDFLSTRKKRIQDYFFKGGVQTFLIHKDPFFSVGKRRGEDLTLFWRAISISKLP